MPAHDHRSPRHNALAESLRLLDGGANAYPRMLDAIAAARDSIHLEMYAFSPLGVGKRFVDALVQAAERGVAVHVVIDGWGSASGGRKIAAELRVAGCSVTIHNQLRTLLIGRFDRNHRKILIVDDEVAFIGGINIGEENLRSGSRAAWADLALEIRGPPCALLRDELEGGRRRAMKSPLRISLGGFSGGWRLRRRYLAAIRGAKVRIDVAHGYFLPDRGVLRAITAAARRGVRVRLLLAGKSDVPFARLATRSLHRRLQRAGVEIREWNRSVLHAKVATIDGRRLLVGSFNLDPLSLANLETLVEVDDRTLVARGEAWIDDHFARSPVITVDASTAWERWCLEPLGRAMARMADVIGRAMTQEPSAAAGDSPP